MVWKGDSRNRLAKSLVTLIDDIVERFPGRDDQNDGTIGDAAHQTRESDHNPHVRQDGMGIVTALDITHDPAEGFDAQAFADSLREPAHQVRHLQRPNIQQHEGALGMAEEKQGARRS